MQLYGVHFKYSHIDLKCQEFWAHAHTPHTPFTCLPLVAVMAVFCCVVLRDVALAEATRTSSRKKVVPLPTAVTWSILIRTVCQAERCLPFIEHPLTPLHFVLPVKVSGMLLAISCSVSVEPLGIYSSFDGGNTL